MSATHRQGAGGEGLHREALLWTAENQRLGGGGGTTVLGGACQDNQMSRTSLFVCVCVCLHLTLHSSVLYHLATITVDWFVRILYFSVDRALFFSL